MAENLENNFAGIRKQIDDYITFGQIEELTYLLGYVLQKISQLGAPISQAGINELSRRIDKWANKL